MQTLRTKIEIRYFKRDLKINVLERWQPLDGGSEGSSKW